MMRLAETFGGIVIALVLGVLSLPWVFYALGRAALGDAMGADRAVETAPLTRWLDWMETR